MHAASLSELICVLPVLIQRILFHWCSLAPLAFNSFCLFHGVGKFWGKGFGGDIPFRSEHPKSPHSLYNVWLWVSIFVPICSKRKLLWWGWNKALIYEYTRLSLGVILSLHWFCLFSFVFFFHKTKTSIIRVYPKFLDFLVSGSWQPK